MKIAQLRRALTGSLAAIGLVAGTMVQASEGWDYEFSFYAWAKSIEGTSGDVDIDLDFWDDIIDALEGAFFGSLEAERGRWRLYGAFEYSNISDNARIERDFDLTIPPDGPTVPVTAGTRGEVTLQEMLADVGVGWAFSESDTTRWEVLGGAKWFDYETEFKFSKTSITGPGGEEIPLKNRKVDVKEDWWHPFVGISARTRLSDAWRLRVRSDYGYEDSDNTSWLVEAVVDWRFNSWGALAFGYTYLDVDYDSGGAHPYKYDVDQHGPVVGLIVHF